MYLSGASLAMVIPVQISYIKVAVVKKFIVGPWEQEIKRKKKPP
jgi:hypothetical protein